MGVSGMGRRALESRCDPADQAEFYRRVGELLQDLGGVAAAPDAGVRLFWARGQEMSWRDLPARPGCFAVAGRHERCDLGLPEDPDISLRHLLASAHRLLDGRVALRLLSLRARLPFFLDDERPHTSIVAIGPVVLRLGSYQLAAVPVGPGQLGSVPDQRVLELPRYSKSEEQAPLVPYTLPGAPEQRTWAGVSRVTTAPAISEVNMLARTVPMPADVFARLSFQQGCNGALVALSERDLRRGVLIGRAPKCLEGGLAGVLSQVASRVHLLLLREGRRTCAYDLCSTNGTLLGGRRTRWMVLPPRVTLDLGHGIRMRWVEDVPRR